MMSHSAAGLAPAIRNAIRSLGATPLPSAAALITIGLATGAAVTVFTVLYAALLKPLPFPDPDRLVVISSEFPSIHLSGMGLSPPEFFELRELTRAWAAIGAVRFSTATLGSTEPQRVGVAAATADLIRALDVPPLLGRALRADDDRPGATPVAILGHGVWIRTYGADPGIVGRVIDLDGRSREVIGVMPPGFDLLGAGTDVWVPLGLDPGSPGSRGDHNLRVVARIAPSLTDAKARADLHGAVARWMVTTGELHSPAPRFHPLALAPLLDATIGDTRRTLWLLAGAVAVLLALACANVANLFVARAEARREQMAVRVALGASRSRLLLEQLTESFLISAGGTGMGLLLAHLITATLASTSLPLPRQQEIGIDSIVFTFAAGLIGVCGLAAGVLPVLRFDFGRAAASLQRDGRNLTAPRDRHRAQRLLIACQIAMAVALLAGAGVLTLSFWRLTRVDPGVSPHGVLTFQVSLPEGRYRADERVWQFYERLVADLRSIAGVRAAAAMSGRLPQRRANNTTFLLEGVPVRGHEGMPQVEFIQHLTPGGFEALGIRLLRGRLLASIEPAPVAVVNETLARKLFAGGDPIGRRLRPAIPDTPWFTIVGVVADVKQAGLSAPSGTELFVHHRQARQLLPAWLPTSMEVVVAVDDAAAASLAALARQAVDRIDPYAAVAHVRTMQEVLHGSIARPRFIATTLGAFAGVAVLLACLGVYGVLAFSVAQRTTELGIRLALGATGAQIAALVLRYAALPVASGAILGLAAAHASASMLAGLLYDTSPTDPSTLGGVAGLLVALAFAASWIPARRAARVDPLDALRHT